MHIGKVPVALNAGVRVLLFPALEDAQQLGLLRWGAGIEPAAVCIDASDVGDVQRVGVVASHTVAGGGVVEQPVAGAVRLDDNVIARVSLAQLGAPVGEDAGHRRVLRGSGAPRAIESDAYPRPG
jgi:hypothetical protein